VDLNDILYEDDDIEDDLDSIAINPVASTIPNDGRKKFLWRVQLWNSLVDFNEIVYGGDDVERDINSILLNLVAPTIPKWRMFNILRWCKF
jgi:hypothetical protein